MYIAGFSLGPLLVQRGVFAGPLLGPNMGRGGGLGSGRTITGRSILRLFCIILPLHTVIMAEYFEAAWKRENSILSSTGDARLPDQPGPVGGAPRGHTNTTNTTATLRKLDDEDIDKWKRKTENWCEIWKRTRCRQHTGRFPEWIVSYNTAHMSIGRANTISGKLEESIVCIQSTCRENEDKVILERNKKHHTYHFPQPNRSSTREKIRAGVAIVVPNTVTHMVESVVTPTDIETIGRAGYVRLKSDKIDTTIITIYCPIEGQNIELTENYGIGLKNAY